MKRGTEVHTSRCGSFSRALEILEVNPQLQANMKEFMITHQYPLQDIAEAFKMATDSATSVKVVVNTAESEC